MTEDEFRTGQGDAFEASRNVAEAIKEGQPFDYVAEAFLTLSPSWHGQLVAKHVFTGRMNAAILAAYEVDQIKKTLFYGRDNGLSPSLGAADVHELPVRFGDSIVDSSINIIHAILGVFSEAGELLEALRDAINLGEPVDAVNIKEEVGDVFWYIAILAKECGFTFDEAQRVNIAKLRARFPDRFTEYDANNRDLTAERAILEAPIVGNADELSDEAKERLSK